MPEHTGTLKAYDCPILIKQKIEEKRRVFRDWHQLQTPKSKRLFNTATQKSSKTTKITASKHSCKVLRQQTPLFPVEGDRKSETGKKKFTT
jgi:hypothetical protein